MQETPKAAPNPADPREGQIGETRYEVQIVEHRVMVSSDGSEPTTSKDPIVTSLAGPADTGALLLRFAASIAPGTTVKQSSPEKTQALIGAFLGGVLKGVKESQAKTDAGGSSPSFAKLFEELGKLGRPDGTPPRSGGFGSTPGSRR